MIMESKFFTICEATSEKMIFYDHEWKKCQHHRDNGITVIFLTVVKNIDKQWNTSLFYCKAQIYVCIIYIVHHIIVLTGPFFQISQRKLKAAVTAKAPPVEPREKARARRARGSSRTWLTSGRRRLVEHDLRPRSSTGWLDSVHWRIDIIY